ncbi:hypothetical protein A3J20_02970 [Candidatus Gottesmanbacteria bacterium RIFCSPLOWO2_02_FULL_42_29]|uniref:Uncharacterized protein n=2 Tax=Candidatus Gottesmaniibacteriota TaxID=1752720 RepID=A0A1F6B7H1_9BACT|nr:MAG: hypothetical protein A2781_01865 [Candidatus Gottesmanbacteria bacterium RIFCSPHIGHO2_01_FULL_42_27]OGG19498.1 MAG: hypothetical protein A3E72_06955 [Candidatus Gottesmanbacteria bacterium RIFCSPHIGHO2_12_FULL_43_26]OGG32921.1 MAG: hypothetical protein A2968_06655 [Candidatus Gottesmanbacteria bacterium RIFCSPLOWO2_01_FULL_42_22]OGG36034.1 MAG: hypothetical protein A3G68_04800 [Candidatus Gottesmanbacteria bacterium RIFCSPLOWO2_12_FULL_42_10]OGG36930.1 MAG: hypothetical protein A3J20_02
MNLMIKRALLAGTANLILGFVLNWIFAIIFPSITREYMTGSLFRPWTDPLMTVYFLYPYILGFSMAYFWPIIEKNLKGKDVLSKAGEFAKLYFIIATVPGMFITYTSFNISLLMVCVWALTGFLQAFLYGLVFFKVNKKIR